MQRIKRIDIEMDENTIKSFIVKELKVKDLISLSQSNLILSGDSSSRKTVTVIPGFAFINNLIAFRPDVEQIMSKSCDFTFDDLIELPPSDIKEIYEGFLEVNQIFFGVLEKLGVKEMLLQIINDFTESFSKQLVL